MKTLLEFDCNLTNIIDMNKDNYKAKILIMHRYEMKRLFSH